MVNKSLLFRTAVLFNVALLSGLINGLFSGPLGATTITYIDQFTGEEDTEALGFPVPVPIDSQLAINGFRTYSSLFARHQDMAFTSESITSHLIGNTVNGENIWAYQISDNDTFTKEGVIAEGSMLQNGGIHAREWQSPEVVTGIIERFYENENDNGFYQYLIENANMMIIPVLNVEGFKQTQRFPNLTTLSTDLDDGDDYPRDGRMRRKNMRGVDTFLSTADDNLFGTDLNRNNDPYWATNPNRSSGSLTSIVHHGSGPASEPETVALQSAARLTNDTLRFYIDTHSFTKIYFAPLTANASRNALTRKIADKMRAVNDNQYAYGPSPSGEGIGSTDEYFAEVYDVPSYTLETEPGQRGGLDYDGFGVSHDGFILPDSEIARVRTQLANASILGYYMQADQPAVTQIKIVDKDSGDMAFAGKWLAANTANRNWEESANQTLEANRSYRMHVSFNKVMRWKEANLTAQYPGQNISLLPLISLEGLDAQGNAYQEVISSDSGSWLSNEDDSNTKQHYDSDTYTFEFSLAENSPVFNAQLLQLSITATDLAGQSIDANPATIAQWQSGAWAEYESTQGNITGNGGIDRSVRLIDDGSPDYFDPSTTTPAPTPPTPPTTSTSSSSGGSTSPLWLMVTLGLLGFRQRRR